jgi:hypothetical protein
LTRTAFLSNVEAFTGETLPALELEQLILRNATIEPGLEELARELARKYRLSLLADIPPEWVEAIINKGFFKHIMISNRILDWRVPREEQEDTRILGSRIRMHELRQGSTLFVDREARRAMTIIRAGYDAAIYVNAERFRRDLQLWGICQ